MKRLSLAIILFIVIGTEAIAQETVLVSKNRENVFEEYSVLKSNKKIKHGHYTKLSKGTHGELTLIELGPYSDNIKEGYWEFYYENLNNIKEKGFYHNGIRDSIWVYFFSEHLLRKLEEVTTAEGTYLKILNANPVIWKTGQYKDGKLVGTWKFYNGWGQHFQTFDYNERTLLFHEGIDLNTIQSGFIGGKVNEQAYLEEFFQIDELMNSINSKMRLESGEIVFQFTIDETGQLKNITEIKNSISNKKIYNQAIETINLLNNQYYPMKEDGIAKESQKKIIFLLDIKSTQLTTMEMMSKSKNFSFKILVEDL